MAATVADVVIATLEASRVRRVYGELAVSAGELNLRQAEID
jgi:hypothetical protein